MVIHARSLGLALSLLAMMASFPLAPSSARAEQALDQVAWEAIRHNIDSDLLEAFVQEYPTSTFRAEAEARIAAIRLLRGGAAPSSLVPQPVSVEATDIPAPSLASRKDLTLESVTDPALSDKLPETDAPPQPDTLVALPSPTEVPSPGAEGEAVPSAADTPADDGAATKGSAAKAAPETETGDNLVRSIQTVLDARGCKPGVIDGSWDKRTRRSAWRFIGRLKGSKIDADAPSVELYEALETAPAALSCQSGERRATKRAVTKPEPKRPVAAKPSDKPKTVAKARSPKPAAAKARKGRSTAPKAVVTSEAPRRAKRSRKRVEAVAEVTPAGAVPPSPAKLKPIVDPAKQARIDRWIKNSGGIGAGSTR